MVVAQRNAAMSIVHQVEENKHQKMMPLPWPFSYLWRGLVYVSLGNKEITEVLHSIRPTDLTFNIISLDNQY